MRAFFHKWLKWRSYSRLLTCYFVYWPYLIDVGPMPLSFAGNTNFANKLRIYIFNIEFMYDNLNFSFLLWRKLHLHFETFLLPVSIYTERQKKRPGKIAISYLKLKYQKYILWLYMNAEIYCCCFDVII